MKTIKTLSGVIAILATVPLVGTAEEQRPVTIQQKLESEYKLTKTTNDKSGIVTAGSVVVLHKDNLLMVDATAAANPCKNTYRDGRVSPGGACSFGTRIVGIPGIGIHIPHADKVPATRTFVSGEKFWVTRIDVRDASKKPEVSFDFFTDAIPDNDQGIRYRGQLTIPFGASKPTPDEALKLVAEVITVVPPDDATDGSNAQPAPQGGQQETASESQPAAPPAPIAPPPPPPPDTVEVSEGQTIDQVIAEMGQPLKDLKVGTKEIYVYKNLKVTFVNGKVNDVE
ncbi:MAG TPA: hypothetical protein VMR62_37920 [Bryobacteraceae bacterium]|nr:hypothetical protein [Bryobacteraceae bacterium]